MSRGRVKIRTGKRSRAAAVGGAAKGQKHLEASASVLAMCLEVLVRGEAFCEERAIELGKLAETVGMPSNDVAPDLFGMETSAFAVMPRFVGHGGVRVWIANRQTLQGELDWLRDEIACLNEQVADFTALIGRMDQAEPVRQWTDSAASGEKIAHAG